VGSNVIESGVRRMCEPITKRIDVSQLDSFACRQLDNLGYTMEEGSNGEQAQSTAMAMTTNMRKRTKDQADRTHSPAQSRSSSWVSMHEQQQQQMQQKQKQQQPAAYTNGKSPSRTETSAGGRGGWLVGNIVASAKERAIAYREDSMRRLKYCLDWVIYSAALISQHMRELRGLLASLHEAAHIVFSGSAEDDEAMVQQNAQQQRLRQHELALRLARARREIVGAVRKAVGVVSNYAGSVLPGEARRQVRNLILGMPGRWMAADPAAAMSQSGGSSGGSPSVVSEPNSGPSSPVLAGADMAPANIEATTRRTLAFASESFQMLNGISGVFGHLYANAERWVGSSAAEPLSQAEQQLQQQAPAADSFSAYRSEGANGDGLRVRRPQRRLPLNMTPMGNGGDDDAASAAAAAISRLSTTSLGEETVADKRRSLPPQQQHQHQQQPLFGGAPGRVAASAATSPMLRASGAASTAFRYSRYDDYAAAGDDVAGGDDWGVVHKRNRTREPTPTRM
ncbi:transcriptional regulator opi1, partial [Coemansia sp. RSA 1933]